jgi:hypothetical protein
LDGLQISYLHQILLLSVITKDVFWVVVVVVVMVWGFGVLTGRLAAFTAIVNPKT